MADQVVPLSVIEDRLEEIERTIQQLQIERTMLNRLKQQAVNVRPANGTKPTASRRTAPTERPGASEAIVAYVKELPGQRGEDIANALEDKIETSSDNPRRIVLNTISNLIVRKRLERDASGGLILANR